MTTWLSVEEGMAAKGLRIAPVRGSVPSPWSEFCRALFHVKKVPCALVSARDPKSGLTTFKAATGHDVLPVVLWNEERPRASWIEQLALAERLVPEPALLPDTPGERARVIGFLSELCTEGGFGWCRRLMLIDRMLHESQYGDRERLIGQYLAGKYGYQGASIAEARQRCEEVVAAFARLAPADAPYLVGSRLTALDLGWAAFAALIRPLAEPDCAMHPMWRDLYTWVPTETAPEVVEALLARRDSLYRGCLELPVVI
jgi:glutathione S-transferase